MANTPQILSLSGESWTDYERERERERWVEGQVQKFVFKGPEM